MTEKLANLEWYYVLLIVISLLGVRTALLKLLPEQARNEFTRTIAEVAESLAIAMALVFFIIRPLLVQAFFIPSGSMRPTLLEDDHILVNKLVYRFKQPASGDVIVFKAPAEWDREANPVDKDYIKRLIGVAGDTIEVKSGVFMVGAQRYFRGKQPPSLPQKLIEFNLLPSSLISQDEIPVKLIKDGVIANGKKITKKELAAAFGVNEREIIISPGQTIRNGKPMDDPYIAEDPDYSMEPVKVGENELFVLGDNRNNSNDGHINGMLDRKRLIGKAMFIFWPINRIRLIH